RNPKGRRGSVQHAKGGAYALHHQPYEQVEGLKEYIIELISLIVASHHRGLDNFDKMFLSKLETEHMPTELIGVDTLVEEEVKQALSFIKVDFLEKIAQSYDFEQSRIYLSILVRFVLSALVDADYLDTAAYFNN